MKKFVVYLRVSTTRQGQSGLGLEGQRAAAERYIASIGGEISAEFVEIESGKRADRPKLAAAIAEARRLGGVLVVAKLDRLARNVAFTSALMEAGCEFVACDMPAASRLTIHLLAAIAENEARMISDRTKAALAAKRARGEKLGNVATLTDSGRQKGADAMRAKAQTAYAGAGLVAKAMRDAGATLAEIADKLTASGFRTLRGGAWSATAVHRVLARAS